MYTKEQAIENAINYAKVKNAIGLLLKCCDPEVDEKMGTCSDDGDYETVYSIISLYSDDINNDGTWADHIEDALSNIYPDYF